MNDLNSILIEGRLTADPTTSYTSKGTALCTFSIAINRFYRPDQEMKEETSFLDIETLSAGLTSGSTRKPTAIGSAKPDIEDSLAILSCCWVQREG